MDEDDEIIIVFLIFMFGFLISMSGAFFLSGIGLLGIEKQQFVFDFIDMISEAMQMVIRWVILPAYFLVVGTLAAIIILKTDWKNETEEE